MGSWVRPGNQQNLGGCSCQLLGSLLSSQDGPNFAIPDGAELQGRQGQPGLPETGPGLCAVSARPFESTVQASPLPQEAGQSPWLPAAGEHLQGWRRSRGRAGSRAQMVSPFLETPGRGFCRCQVSCTLRSACLLLAGWASPGPQPGRDGAAGGGEAPAWDTGMPNVSAS